MAQPKVKGQGPALHLQRDPAKHVESGRSGEVGAPILDQEGRQVRRGPGHGGAQGESGKQK